MVLLIVKLKKMLNGQHGKRKEINMAGYYCFHINVFKEPDGYMKQLFDTAEYKTQSLASKAAKEVLANKYGDDYDHAEIHIMHYTSGDYNDKNAIVFIRPKKRTEYVLSL